jgi:hypothetical protein
MLKIEKWARNPLYVDVVEVTEENMAEVAKWCEGTVETEDDRRYIKVDVIKPTHHWQSMAFAGDRVLKTDAGLKVYKPKAFAKSFVPASELVSA